MCIINKVEKIIILKSSKDIRFKQEQVERWQHTQNDWSMFITFNSK
jgi:hypothetical protein